MTGRCPSGPRPIRIDAGRVTARLNPVEEGERVRLTGILMSALCLAQQLSAVCTHSDHARSLPNASTASKRSSDYHPSPCGHNHSKECPQPPMDFPHRESPVHLCTAAHVMFVAPTIVQLPDPPAPQWWEGARVCIRGAGMDVPSGLLRFGNACGESPTTAPLRAELQLFQI